MNITSANQKDARALHRWVLGSAFITSLVGAVFAQTAAIRAEAPTVKVGDRWKYEQDDRRTGLKDSELERKVTSVTATRIEGTENDGRFVMTTELGLVESSTTVVTGESKPLSFPLEVGKKWEYKYNYANKLNENAGRWQLEATVSAYEKVKVAAGEFDAFKVEYTGFWNNDTTKRNGHLKLSNWYAPAARSVVKSEYDDGRNSWVRQLVEFQIQP